MSAHTPGLMVEFELEPDQTERILGVLDEAAAADKAGQKGIVFAQVFSTHAKVCFIAEPFASEIKDVLTRRAAAFRAAKTPGSGA